MAKQTAQRKIYNRAKANLKKTAMAQQQLHELGVPVPQELRDAYAVQYRTMSQARADLAASLNPAR